ncbi:MAG: threonine/serine exporter family protein [Thermotogae bacterium]|jgi:uncharacterized membrane protein YjjP (DUF1212 family)|nr:threonine/serine exporter family protein [Thermotogota bacterium]
MIEYNNLTGDDFVAEDIGKTLDFMVDTAAALMRTGSPTTRTEIWISRIGNKLGFEVDVAIIYTVIYITIKDSNGNAMTMTKRTGNLSSDFDKFIKIDALVKKFVDGKMNLSGAHSHLNFILNADFSYPIFIRLIAAALACGGFEYILVGGLMSAIASMVLGAMVYAATNYIRLLDNRFFQQFSSGVIIAIGSWILMPIFKGSALNGIISGSIMLFVPGLLITNGFSEISQGSVISGTIKESEALALLVALVFGISVGSVFVGGMKF